MSILLRLSSAAERLVALVGRLGSWAVIALVAVTLFDVMTRRFLVLGSTRLQELEWHFHTILMMFVIGYGLVRKSHVRVDLVRERLGTKGRAWLELAGSVFFLVPYALLVIVFSFEFVRSSYLMNEASASMTGLSHRWIIKSTMIVGFVMVMLAGLATVVRHCAFLFGGYGADILNAGSGEHDREELENA